MSNSSNNKTNILIMSIFNPKQLKTKFFKGFTLIELLVVVAIISLLSSIIFASIQVARQKAITAKITEDLKQMQLAANIAYDDNNSYIFISFLDSNKYKEADLELFLEEDSLFIKKAHAQSGVLAPAACVLFKDISEFFISKGYLKSVPVHPLQDYSKGICYKAVNSLDGSYLAVYAETPATFDFGGVRVSKQVGFVAGDTSINNLEKIRVGSQANGDRGYLQTPNNQPITSIADIFDEVVGVTRGVAASYGRSGSTGTTGGSGQPVSCPSGQAINPSGVCQELYTGAFRVTCISPNTPDPFSVGCLDSSGNTVNGGTLTLGGSGGPIITQNPCSKYGAILIQGSVNPICVDYRSGCNIGEMGPCYNYPIGEEEYDCPIGKNFLYNDFWATINGTCVDL